MDGTGLIGPYRQWLVVVQVLEVRRSRFQKSIDGSVLDNSRVPCWSIRPVVLVV